MMDSSRGHRLPITFMLLAIVVATAVVAIGVALGGGSKAVAAPGDDATIVAETFQVRPNGISSSSAQCPGNQRVIGGGVIPIGSPKYYINVRESGPLDETKRAHRTETGDIAKYWWATVSNGSNQEQRTFKVYAICSATSDATIQETTFEVPPSRFLSEGKHTEVQCPGNQRALGGGVANYGGQFGPPDPRPWVRASGPLATRGKVTVTGGIAKRWYVSVINRSTLQNPQAMKLRAFAICSDTSNATIQVTSFNLGAPPAEGEGFAKCPADQRGLGGGVIPSGQETGLWVAASGPLDNTAKADQTMTGDITTQWYAAVRKTSASGAEQAAAFKVFAICE